MSRISSREFWIPGWWQAVVFMLLVLMGLGTWVFSRTAASFFSPQIVLVEMALDTGVVFYALLALVSGFVLPKGFYLWGIAIVFTHPFAALIDAAYLQAQGADIVYGGVMGWVNYAVVLVMLTVATGVLTSALSTVGAGLRLMSDHFRHRSSGTSRDVRVR